MAFDPRSTTLLVGDEAGTVHFIEICQPSRARSAALPAFRDATLRQPTPGGSRARLASLNAQAVVLEESGATAAAQRAYTMAFDEMLRLLGLEHPWTACVLHNLGCLGRADRWRDDVERSLGDEHARLRDARMPIERALQARTSALRAPIARETLRVLQSVLHVHESDARQEVIDAALRIRLTSQEVIDVRTKKRFTRADLAHYVEWLAEGGDDIIGSAAHALCAFVGDMARAPLELLSIAILLTDTCNDVTVPYGVRPKASLFAVSHIARAYKPECIQVRLERPDVRRLSPPFIANFSNEEFVTVTEFSGDRVSYSRFGLMQHEDFVMFATRLRLSPFIAIERSNIPADLLEIEEVPDTMCAFVWG